MGRVDRERAQVAAGDKSTTRNPEELYGLRCPANKLQLVTHSITWHCRGLCGQVDRKRVHVAASHACA